MPQLVGDAPGVEPRLREHFDRVTRRRGGLGAPQIALRGPDVEFAYGDQQTPFHAASIGKLFTAVIVMQLVEAGRLALDSRIDELLPAATVRGLFAADAPSPTVLELLQHYSGAADYFEGRRGARLIDEVAANPDRVWTPEEMLDFARERLGPIADPGRRFRYSDTGYVLLGLAIEEIVGEAYHDAVSTRIVEPLGLERTFLPRLTAPARGDRRIAPCYLGRQDLSGTAALSCGWAGGGVAATPGELLRFGEALHGGELIGEESLAVMRAMRGRVRAGIHYGAGMMQLRFDGFSPMLRGMPRPLGHLGSLSTALLYDPGSRSHLVMNFHARREMSRSVRSAIAVARVLGRANPRPRGPMRGSPGGTGL